MHPVQQKLAKETMEMTQVGIFEINNHKLSQLRNQQRDKSLFVCLSVPKDLAVTTFFSSTT